MTGEILDNKRKLHARENVIHEAGLFQARLGYKRTIILLEEGCEPFSNNSGIGEIRFAKGKMKECFDRVCGVLVREEIIAA
jgi:predicted nucleotide-binding protein